MPRRVRQAVQFGLLATIAVLLITPARADAGWFPSGDTRLRLDLQLLNDAEVIELPISYWPIPRAAVRYALSNAKDQYAINAAVAAALERVRARVEDGGGAAGSLHADVRGGEPGLWRDFDTIARENGELGAGADYERGRYSVGIELTAVTVPDDGHEIRFDGSQASVQLGNWMLSAHEMDRWWGPGHEGSLILSNNARPMPTLMVERAEARAFATKWLSWLGPWRLSFGLSQMEDHRQDIDEPLFMAWRLVVMPTHNLEIGFSRTAQFCGRELECNPTVIKNLLIGNDNVGIDVSAAAEPGNQMAGFDLRWNSPIGDLPYAIYSQYIGEDESGYLPAKFLGQLGIEVWHPVGDGIVQGFLEWSNTECTGKHGTVKTCAYNQGRFNVEGYRYQGRSLGYTADRDADNWALGGIFTGRNGELWTATARVSKLSKDAYGDTRNTVATVPTDYRAIEFGWKGHRLGQQFSADIGVETLQPTAGAQDTEVYGFVGWHHEFRP